METIISTLFAARDEAHRLHLNTRSFAAHVALGDFYEELVELADNLAEIYQGMYGLIDIKPHLPFSCASPVDFISQLARWAQTARDCFDRADTNLLNEWDTVLSTIFRTKYKLENLH